MVEIAPEIQIESDLPRQASDFAIPDQFPV